MNPDLFPRRDWEKHPYDRECRTFVPFDPVVDAQIRCKVPLWSGDFNELKPELTAQGLTLAELPLLTVQDVGQYVIRAAQGGSLRVGAIGTAANTIVSPPPPASPAAAPADDEYVSLARKHFASMHWKILEVCIERGFIDRASARSTDEITAYVAGNGGRAARGDVGDLRRYFDFLTEHGFLAAKRGVGTYATRQAAAVVKARAAERAQGCRVV